MRSELKRRPMLPISQELKIPADVLYLSFRAACLRSLDLIRLSLNLPDDLANTTVLPVVDSKQGRKKAAEKRLRHWPGRPSDVDLTGKGFLETISIVRGAAIQAQLECLLRTWHRLQCDGQTALTELDICVCFCATEELALLASSGHQRRLDRLQQGPRTFTSLDSVWLTSKLRLLQLTWPFLAQAGKLLQSGQLLNDELDVHNTHHHSELVRQFLDLVGQWHVDPAIADASVGLLTDKERIQLDVALQVLTQC